MFKDLGFIWGFVCGFVSGFLIGYGVSPNSNATKEDGPLDADDFPASTPLVASIGFVTHHISCSFTEGMKIEKYGSLGKALLSHWDHAHRHFPEKVMPLTGTQRGILKYHPAVFFSIANCSEQFDIIVNHLD